MTTLQRNVPEHALSRISSFDWLGSVALNPIGYALIGPLAAAFGTSETLLIAAVLNIAVCSASCSCRRSARCATSSRARDGARSAA